MLLKSDKLKFLSHLSPTNFKVAKNQEKNVSRGKEISNQLLKYFIKRLQSLHPDYYSSFFVSIIFSVMRHVLSINTHGKGGFAILGDVKVKKGAVCSLKRNNDNLHG
jgi:hypothetical protein